MMSVHRLAKLQREMKKRQPVRRGRRADALRPTETDVPIDQRKLVALRLLQVGHYSHALIAIHDSVRLPIATIKKLAEALEVARSL